MKNDRPAAGVPVCHLFVRLGELHLLFGPQNAFPLTHPSRSDEEVPFSFRRYSSEGESHSVPTLLSSGHSVRTRCLLRYFHFEKILQ